jgi:hypothetical protein
MVKERQQKSPMLIGFLERQNTLKKLQERLRTGIASLTVS